MIAATARSLVGRGCLAAGLWLAWVPLPGAAQAETERVDLSGEVFVDGEAESYLRLMQLVGKSPLYPWSIRSFSPREVERLAPGDSAHPWAERVTLGRRPQRLLSARVLRPRVGLIQNTGFPFGYNDGPVWAGRGFTTVLEAGGAARLGPLSLTLAPVFFRTENRAFQLSREGEWQYNDLQHPLNVDHPQRFGDQPYQRLDPGQSTLRLDLPFVTLGASTADQHWGPVMEFPILLGSNSGGFPHLFLGTGRPTNVLVGKLHARVIWGSLQQSEFSPAADSASRRFATGAVLAFQPRGIRGLELGVARFFEETWTSEGLGHSRFTKAFESFLTTNLPDLIPGDLPPDHRKYSPDNQLASVFARWVFPGSQAEVYGEFGREDHNFDFRDLVLEPDQQSGYVLGLRKAWVRTPERVVSLRAEVMNAQVTHLVEVRQQLPFYVHNAVRQGHTQRGQLLGSPWVYGGQGAIVRMDNYTPQGRWSVSWSRLLRSEASDYWLGGNSNDNLTGYDVLHTLGVDATWFRGRLQVDAGARAIYNFNRNFIRDVAGLNLFVGLRSAL